MTAHRQRDHPRSERTSERQCMRHQPEVMRHRIAVIDGDRVASAEPLKSRIERIRSPSESTRMPHDASQRGHVRIATCRHFLLSGRGLIRS
jgi:hypothetical protein